MEDYKSFLDLDNKGSVLFLFSDKNNIFAIYEDLEDKCFFMFQMDKTFIIEAISEIKLPDDFVGKTIKWLKWNVPTQTNTKSYNFTGFCLVEGVNYTFKIDDSSVMTSTSSNDITTVTRQRTQFSNLSCLKTVTVEAFAKKGNNLHVVGLDNEYKEQVYCVVDLDKDICVKRYHLRSDEGDLKVNAVSLDPHEQRVYLGGEISRYYDADDTFLYSTPYVETFLLNRG